MERASEADKLRELREIAEAAEVLAQEPEAFTEAFEAFQAQDTSQFQAVLERVALLDRCRLICYFLCRKHCVAICHRFCPDMPSEPTDVAEMIEFAHVLGRLAKDEKTMMRLLEIIEAEDVDGWQKEIKKLELVRFCHQLCHFFCMLRCEIVCRRLCPPRPLITRVGSIPVSQIDAQGYGNGPSIPPFHVAPPNPAAGYGDHPFGGSVWLKGIFNMVSATQYLVEVSSTGPGGPYDPILVSQVKGYNDIPVFPWLVDCIRTQSGGADPGWFNVSEICDSDGGPDAFGEKTLLYWPTSVPDGLYHLRLRVRDGTTTRVSSPQAVQLDNTGPFPLPRPTITLELERPDGTRVPLKCGQVKKGDGLIVVTIHAFDPNLSRITVTARGNSGLSVPVVDTSSVPLSKTYNGNLADQGYPVPTEFMWDPWSDPRIVPCCYVVYVEVWDRAILNDHYSGGHHRAGWEAIEIGF
jgi:hypothetical protein